MSFKDFSAAHPDMKLSPLATKQSKPQSPKAMQQSIARAEVAHAHAPRQSATKH